MTETPGLPALLREPGVVVGSRDGASVAVHYGSAAGELAACVRGVGLAARTDLTTIALRGRPRSLELLTRRLIGATVRPGGVGAGAGGWWCRDPNDGGLLVICPRRRARRVARDIDRFANGTADLSADLTVLGVVGARAAALLAQLGVLGPDADIRKATPFSSVPVASYDVHWLLETGTQALAVTKTGRALSVWSAIQSDGRSFGITRVGLDAVQRYQLTERARALSASVDPHPFTRP